MERSSLPERELAVADRLHSAAIHLLRRLRREDDAAGLGAPQLSALSVVVFAGPLSLGELADAERVRPPTMSRVVRQLEKRGLVSREHDPRDRRIVRLRATPQGVSTLEQGRHRRVLSLAQRLGELEPQQLSTLETATLLLERLLEERW